MQWLHDPGVFVSGIGPKEEQVVVLQAKFGVIPVPYMVPVDLTGQDNTRRPWSRGVECAEFKASARTLGWEADLAIKQRWVKQPFFSLETGDARTTDCIPVEF